MVVRVETCAVWVFTCEWKVLVEVCLPVTVPAMSVLALAHTFLPLSLFLSLARKVNGKHTQRKRVNQRETEAARAPPPLFQLSCFFPLWGWGVPAWGRNREEAARWEKFQISPHQPPA